MGPMSQHSRDFFEISDPSAPAWRHAQICEQKNRVKPSLWLYGCPSERCWSTEVKGHFFRNRIQNQEVVALGLDRVCVMLPLICP